MNNTLINTNNIFYFNEADNVLFSIILLIVTLSISFKAFKIFKQYNNIKLFIISAAFFFAGILELIHSITGYWTYEITKVGNPPLAFVFSFISNIFSSSCTLLSLIYQEKYQNYSVLYDKKTTYLKLSVLLITLVTIIILFNYIFSDSFNYYTNLIIRSNPMAQALDNTFYILAATVLIYIRKNNNKKIISLYEAGLIFLGVTQIYVTTSDYMSSEFRWYIHITRIIGYILLYAGLKNFDFDQKLYNFRIKLFVYPGLFLIVSYYIFITILTLTAGFKFPDYTQYVILFYLAAIILLEFIFSENFNKPLSNLITGIEKITPESSNIEIPIISNDEIGILTDKINEINNTIHNHLIELKMSKEQYKEIFEREDFIQKITKNMLESGTFELDSIIKNINIHIMNLLGGEKITLRFFDSDTQSFSDVKGEEIVNPIIKSIKGKYKIIEVDNFWAKELIKGNIKIIHDINTEDCHQAVKEYYKSQNIISQVILPVKFRNKLIAGIFISSSKNSWYLDEKQIYVAERILRQIALAINLFMINDKLKHSLNNEKFIRKFISEIRKYESHDEIYICVLQKLSSLFDMDINIHLHMDEERNHFVQISSVKKYEEYFKKDEILITGKEFLEISKENKLIVFSNDVENDIKLPFTLKVRLLNKKIKAFLIYPNNMSNFSETEAEFVGKIMICCTQTRKWTTETIDFLKLIVDTTAIIYLELKQRIEIDNVKKNFIATLTHDLRSPLIAEQKGLEFMLAMSKKTVLSDIEEYLNDLYKTNEELLRIVNNMLSVYHYESGLWEFDKKLTNIQELIIEAVRPIKYIAKEHQSEIIININEPLPKINIDKNEILRVMNNLISNAIKHTKTGSNVVISAELREAHIMVSISDNGEGIALEDQPNIFQRYPTKKRKVGTGLGLYLSKQIIEAHGGKIAFISIPGKGTTFSFYLPI